MAKKTPSPLHTTKTERTAPQTSGRNTTPSEADANPRPLSIQHDDPIAVSYNAYFNQGAYQRRYPSANPRVMKEIETLIGEGDASVTVLDYGCGNGRYLASILHNTEATVLGFDISLIALEQAIEKIGSAGDRATLFSRLADLEAHLSRHARPEVGLLLFGVLSHISSRRQRVAVLKWFRRHLKWGGHLVISVPNRHRRFVCKQLWQRLRGKPNRDVSITPGHRRAATCGPLHYHLYDLKELKDDLARAGFYIKSVKAESLLPEQVITRCPLLGAIDNWLSNKLPAHWGYGLWWSPRKGR
ncbi:hypothetical protein CS022_21385 [Veronia nyctiphanis]|uniref:Class I SAM-dependent methyltransferase n=1 Tax=Veronia nyctiphanis TaxID=1278244 RepID=A0A4V1LSC5_9GAMM|nr:class I SAM-dependent methyltransferase [Veronia nyctiphanis]RXJ71218.1 hypothetical protein CS022_21385 [Veronia nyctiphanis]